MLKSHILTRQDACMGCNKCILKCPAQANIASFETCKNKVTVNSDRCIDCGECVHICDHDSRSYTDDTERFFADLASGIPLSVVAAPAARTNFPDLEHLFGYLKSQGVHLIYDVSYGADICTWGYLRAIEAQRLSTVIAQPCPVIVNYIEHYKPSLLRYLSPVQSPALCTAIYLHKYQHNNDRIAFLSPCIAKSCEFNDPNSGGYIQYNVTYQKLADYLNRCGVNLRQYPAVKFDSADGSLGFAFSRPGGLKENVQFYLGDDVWVTQVEGMEQVIPYFEEYEKSALQGKPVPLLVDVLNCAHGCNLGTGTARSQTRDSIDYKTNQAKRKVNAEQARQLLTHFDNSLNLRDFLREYENKSRHLPKTDTSRVEEVFTALGKTTPEKQSINCFCCGYGSCREFATEIANGHNHYDNCVHYLEESLAKKLTGFDEQFQTLSAKLSETVSNLNDFEKNTRELQNIALQTRLISINASIESAHAGQAGKGFAVVATEIKRLSDQSSDVIERNTAETVRIIQEIQQTGDYLETIKTELHKTMRSQ